MTPLARILSRGLSRLESIEGNQVVTIDGQDLPVSSSSNQRGVHVEIGGNLVEISLSLFLRQELFITSDREDLKSDDDIAITSDSDTPRQPVAGKLCTFQGVSYRVLNAKRAPGGSHIELHLVDPASGRS